MECVEVTRALKSSFFSKLAMKSANIQENSDDFLGVTGGVADDFSIDEFFNLPNDEFKEFSSIEEEDDDDEEEEEKDSSSSPSLSFSQYHLDDCNFSADLAIPVDDVQELELWSHLMDDSIPEPTLACPNSIFNSQAKKTGFSSPVEPGRKPGLARVLLIPSAVPHKPRSKRPRISAGTRFSFLGSPLKTESSSSSSSAPLSPDSTLLFVPPAHFSGPPQKKQRKKPKTEPAVQRRCTHCQVTKTPQWRAGPNGPKTLCNACGVRFKSGRLFPEYRPACSPSFSSEVHSNSHRKVLEMRKKKETVVESSTDSTSTICSS